VNNLDYNLGIIQLIIPTEQGLTHFILITTTAQPPQPPHSLTHLPPVRGHPSVLVNCTGIPVKAMGIDGYLTGLDVVLFPLSTPKKESDKTNQKWPSYA
jgi:hypothetical protein